MIKCITRNLNDCKHFNSWNRGFVATAFMHHAQMVLDEKYIPRKAKNVVVFQEMKMFKVSTLS
jgi:hypothetical protein